MKHQIKISLAHLSDTKNIMKFMDEIWKKDHILSKNQQLFLHEFQNGDDLNMIIAKDHTKKIVGIFGFMYYNNSAVPDIAGSLWKVDEKIKHPLLGFKLREYFQEHINHNFFAAPGANIKTKPIYKFLKMDWNIMNHYYITNDQLQKFHIAKNPITKKIQKSEIKSIIKKIDKIEEIKDFNFLYNKQLVPKKDFNYIKHKFFDHPIRQYDIYTLSEDNIIKNIFICRVAQNSNNSAYRMVDFYGELDNLDDIIQFLYHYILKKGYEYIDFINYGLDENILLEAGFNKVDFDDDNRIIPNLFEPFIQINSPIYCVSDKTNLEVRQFKADGDQDRPNV